MDLFDRIVLPILLYGSEIFGYENVNILETLHLKFCKYVLGFKRSTPNCMVHVYGELVRCSLDVTIKVIIINFRRKLAIMQNN